MSPSIHDDSRDSPGRFAHLEFLILPILLALFPPETRGESMAGCAMLIALGALVPRPRPASRFILPLALLLAASVPLVLIAEAPGAAVRPLALFFLAGTAGLGAAAVDTLRRRGFLLPTLLSIAAGLVSAYALYQKLWGLDALVRQIEQGLPIADRAFILERARDGRAFAGFPTPAALGGYLILTLPVTVALGLSSTGRRRVGLFALAVLQGAGLLAAESATAGGAILAVLALAALTDARLRRAALIGLAIAALLLAGIVLLRGGEVTGLDGPSSPWKLRAANFRLARSMAVDHRFAGVGPGGFGEAYPRYRLPGDNETQHAHNLPLEMSAEIGIPTGLIVSALFFWLFVGPLFDRRVRGPTWWRGAQIGLAAFALHNLVDFTAFLPSVLWTAAILRGWLAPEPRADRPRISLAWVIVLIGALLAAALAARDGLAWNARVAARQAIAGQDWPAVDRSARRATVLAPWSADAWLLKARAALEIDDPGGNRQARLVAALTDVERALIVAPTRPAARELRARLRRALGDVPGAYADATVAAELYPMKKEYRDLRDQLAGQLPAVEPGAGDAP